MVKKISKQRTVFMITLCMALVVLVVLGAVIWDKYTKNIYTSIDTNTASLEYFARYGTHLNFEGSLKINEEIFPDNVNLIIRSSYKEYELPLEYKLVDDEISFKTSEYINGGINLEILPEGEYIFLLKVETVNKAGSKNFCYYSLENCTDYEGFSYYTISSENSCNNVILEFDSHEYSFGKRRGEVLPVVKISISQTQLPEEYYDIYLEVGHGGDDPGAVGMLNGEEVTEYDLNIAIAQRVKVLLQNMGYKVILSHETNIDPPSYGKGGRAVLPNEVKAKYSFSIHCNSHELSIYTGTEVYAAKGSDFSFASLLAEKIVELSGGSYSNQTPNENHYYQADKGVFVRLFTPENVESTNKDALDCGAKAYENIKAYETNYYYMIREIGGIVTGAYVDGRNTEYGSNPYVNSNDVAEPYILEMNYVNNEESLLSLINNQEGYAKGTAEAINEYINTLKSESLKQIN